MAQVATSIRLLGEDVQGPEDLCLSLRQGLFLHKFIPYWK